MLPCSKLLRLRLEELLSAGTELLLVGTELLLLGWMALLLLLLLRQPLLRRCELLLGRRLVPLSAALESVSCGSPLCLEFRDIDLQSPALLSGLG